jgi:hypothetical protein
MSLMEQIQALINQEVQKQVNDMLTAYAENISKSYKIPLALLLRDIPVSGEKNSSSPCSGPGNMCLGLKKGNVRCKMSGKYEGYCRHHYSQKQKLQPVKILNTVQHNHGIPPLYQENCPACKASAAPPVVPVKKSLIDFSLVLGNE